MMTPAPPLPVVGTFGVLGVTPGPGPVSWTKSDTRAIHEPVAVDRDGLRLTAHRVGPVDGRGGGGYGSDRRDCRTPLPAVLGQALTTEPREVALHRVRRWHADAWWIVVKGDDDLEERGRRALCVRNGRQARRVGDDPGVGAERLPHHRTPDFYGGGKVLHHILRWLLRVPARVVPAGLGRTGIYQLSRKGVARLGDGEVHGAGRRSFDRPLVREGGGRGEAGSHPAEQADDDEAHRNQEDECQDEDGTGLVVRSA